MKIRNTKLIVTLALAATLSSGVITTHAASISSDAWGLTNPKQALTLSIGNNSNISKVQNIFLPKDKQAAVTLWAEALKERNGAFRYAILNTDLKNQEYNKYNKMNWVIGGSSPWILSYKINEKNKIDDKTSEYEINYTMTDSNKDSYNCHEIITVKQLGSNWFVTKHDNYEYFPDNLTENTGSKFSKVQLPSSKSDLLPRDKENTVNLWAEALKERNGAFRYAILNNDLKNQEYEKYNNMNWVIGGSSPKVISYKINEKNKIDDKTSEYKIEYTLIDSTKTLYYANENITVKTLGTDWFVTKHDNYDYLPDVTENVQ